MSDYKLLPILIAIAACKSTAIEAPAPALAVAKEPACPTTPLTSAIERLRDTDDAEALQALYRLARPRLVAIALGDALGCADLPLRYAILRALKREGAQLDAALPAIAAWIDDSDAPTRELALAALEQVGIPGDSPNGDGTRALLARLAKVPHDEQLGLLLTLGRLRPKPIAYARIVAALEDHDLAHRRAGAEAMWTLVDEHRTELPATALEALMKATHDSDPLVRARSIAAIGMLRTENGVRFLDAELGKPIADRKDVVYALGTSGPIARRLQTKLAAIVRMDADDMPTRANAAVALGMIGADSPAALDALAQAVVMPYEHLIERMPTDGREALRQTATTALITLGETNPAVVRAMLARTRAGDDHPFGIICANHPDPKLVAGAVVALVERDQRSAGWIEGCLGASSGLADASVPTLIARTRSTDLWTRQDAATGLGAIRSTVAMYALVAQLGRMKTTEMHGDDVHEALAILHAVARIGSRVDYRALVPWRASEPCVAPAAAVAMVLTTSDQGNSLQALENGLVASDAIQRRCTAKELVPWIADDRFALLRPTLATVMVDHDSGAREAATEAIAALGRNATPFLPQLREQLKTYRSYGEWHGVSAALLAIGPAAAPAYPELVAALRDYNSSHAVIPALAMIVRETKSVDRLRAEFADEGYWLRSQANHVIALATK